MLGRVLVLLLALSMAVPSDGVWAMSRAFAAESGEEVAVAGDTSAPSASTGAGEDGSDSAADSRVERRTLDVAVFEDESLSRPLEDAPKVTITGELPADAEAKAYVDDITDKIEGVDDSAVGLTQEDEERRAKEYASDGETDPLKDDSKSVTIASLNLALYDEAGTAMDANLLKGEVEVGVGSDKLPDGENAKLKVYSIGNTEKESSAGAESAEELDGAKFSDSNDSVKFNVTGAGTYAVVRGAKLLRRDQPLNTGFSARDLGIQTDFFDYYGDVVNGNPFDSGANKFAKPNTTGINSNGHRLQFYGYGSVKKDDPNNINHNISINNYTYGATPLSDTGEDATQRSSALQGIVQNKLGEDGYPVLAPGLRWKYDTDDRTDGTESLSYLFDGSVQAGKKSYMGLDGFIQKGRIDPANNQFIRDENGSYYGYNSNETYAYYNKEQGNGGYVTLYDDTYPKAGTSSYMIGFFPFDNYDSSRNNVGSWDPHSNPNPLNHHNGVTMSATFTLPPDGQVSNADGTKSDMLFSFSGDDDVWVYIDGVLVLDIGGIHQPAQGTINFHTGETTMGGDRFLGRTAYTEDVYDAGAGTTLGKNSSIAQAFEKAGKTFDSSPYSTHTIKFFYLERGGVDSNCMLAMNLAFTKATELTVDKDWADGDRLHTDSDDSVYVQLYRQVDGGEREAVDEPVKLDKDSKDKYGIGPFRHTFDNLPVRDELNHEIKYTVEEGTLEGGAFVPKEAGIQTSGKVYTLDKIEYRYAKGAHGADPKVETYRPDDSSTFGAAFHNGNEDPQIGTAVITNKPSTKLTVEKQWRDDSGNAPDPASYENDSVWVQLYKLRKSGGSFPSEDQATAVGSPIELKASNSWRGEFDIVEEGEDVKYIVREGTYDGSTFTPSDVIYAAKADAADAGQPYQRVSTTYTVDELKQNYKTEVVPTPGGGASQQIVNSLSYRLHYGRVGGILHRYIGTYLTGELDDGIIDPFAQKGVGGESGGLNDFWWSTRDLVPVTFAIPENAKTFKVMGAVHGNDFHIFQQDGRVVRLSESAVGAGYTTTVTGDQFTIQFDESYVASHKGQTQTILVPAGVKRTAQNHYAMLTWLNGFNRHGYIDLQMRGTTLGGSSTTVQTVPDGDPWVENGNASDGGVQFLMEHETSATQRKTTIAGHTVIANKPLKTQIAILKQDADTNEAMNGVTFTLYRSNASWSKGEKISSQTTDIDGGAIFASINDGYYVLEEERGSANSTYALPGGFWKVQIKGAQVKQFLDPSGASVQASDSIGQYVLKNTKVKTELEVLKTDGASSTALQGACFTVSTEGGKYVQADGSLSGSAYEFMTNSSGKIVIRNLTAGTYWLSETKAPVGYQKLGNDIRIQINNDGTQALFYEGAAQQNVSILNHKVSMTVKNSKAPDLPFAGATPRDFLFVGLAIAALGAVLMAFTMRRRDVWE